MPSWTQELESRLASLRLRPEREREIIDELSQHLDLRYAELRDQGVDEAEAFALVRAELLDQKALAEFMRPLRQANAPAPPVPVGAARRELNAGGRRMSVIDFFDSVGRDLRHALRGWRRRPAFTLATVLTLALGIGATTAIFSVVYSVLIKPLSYPNADELVRIRHTATSGINFGDQSSSTSPSMYFTYRDENRTLAEIGLWWELGLTLTGQGDPERVRALLVSHGTLQALGVQPLRGRWFTEAEHGPGAEGPVPIILSHAFWQRRFGGDDAALGREFSIDLGPAQVVGIMPPDFRFLASTPQPDVIVAVRLDPAQLVLAQFSYNALARLKPGVTPAEARADIERMVPIWLDSWPAGPPGATITREAVASWRLAPVVRPLKEDVVGSLVASTLWVLMGAIGAVLLIACANIANLMLVRADARRPEFAMRAALGAVPARIARELLVESLLLGAAGGVLGLVLAYGGLELLVAIGPGNLPRLQEISVYPPVLAFTVAVSLASTLMFGSITALKHAVHIDLPVLGATRGSSAGRERNRTRSAFVVVQVALALVLVVTAALMIRSFQALRDVDPGFSHPATIQTARVWIPGAVSNDPVQYTGLQHEILDKIAALPGVAAAGFASHLPMAGREGTGGGPIEVDGRPQSASDTPPERRTKFVAPGYFEAMGTRLIAGRNLTWSDIDSGGGVAVISEDFARELAAEPAGAIGTRIRPFGTQGPWREVIGVVQSVHEYALYEEPPSVVYWPVLMENMFGRPVIGTRDIAFAIRSDRAGMASLTEEVRQAIWSVNGSLPVAIEGTMEAPYAGSLARTSFTLVMLAIAGAMALALSVLGIYGVIAYVVTQRTREIGIRSALGAEPREIKRMFLLHGLALSAVGAVVGLVAATALGRLMSSVLFGIDVRQPSIPSKPSRWSRPCLTGRKSSSHGSRACASAQSVKRKSSTSFRSTSSCDTPSFATKASARAKRSLSCARSCSTTRPSQNSCGRCVRRTRHRRLCRWVRRAGSSLAEGVACASPISSIPSAAIYATRCAACGGGAPSRRP
jgi:predicted permease